MPDGRIVLHGRLWLEPVELKMENGILLLPIHVVRGLGSLANRQFDDGELISEATVHGSMFPVSSLCHYLGLSWLYQSKLKALILAREEPALRGRRIVLDTGNGDWGKQAKADHPDESALNQDIAARLADILSLSGARVVSMLNDAPSMTLPQRLVTINVANSDMMISIHQNSFLDAQMNGTETYWYGNWAARHLAQKIHVHVLEELGTINRGVREAAFPILRHTPGAPVLIKVGFITGREDRVVIADPWMRQRAALGIFRGVREYSEGCWTQV